MPPKKRLGMTGVYVELPDELLARLESLCESIPIGGKADHIRLAIDRHIRNPPILQVPELPPETVPLKPGKK